MPATIWFYFLPRHLQTYLWEHPESLVFWGVENVLLRPNPQKSQQLEEWSRRWRRVSCLSSSHIAGVWILCFQIPGEQYKAMKQTKRIFLFSCCICVTLWREMQNSKIKRKQLKRQHNSTHRGQPSPRGGTCSVLWFPSLSLLGTMHWTFIELLPTSLLYQRFSPLQWATASIDPNWKNKCSYPDSGAGAKGDGSMAAGSSKPSWLPTTTISYFKWVEPWQLFSICDLISSNIQTINVSSCV